MKFYSAVLSCLALCQAHLVADDFTITVKTSLYLQTQLSPNFTLYDEFGDATGYSSPGTWLENIDIDNDGTYEYSILQLGFSSVPPGRYSIQFQGHDGLQYFYAWTWVDNLAQMNGTDMGYESFAYASAPSSSNAQDTVVTGYLDIHGNWMNFGTLVSSNPALEGPAIQQKYHNITGAYSIAQGRYYGESGGLASIQWAFPFSYDLQAATARMSLHANGRLSLNGGELGGVIEINPNTASMTINGNSVLTQQSLPSLSSLRIGGATSAANGSIVTGSGSSALGTNGLVAGVGLQTNSYAMVAFGGYNSLSASQTLSNWVPSDDVFVIGNGTSSSARSNAVTIKKNGTAYLHGSVVIGSNLIVGSGTSVPQTETNQVVLGAHNAAKPGVLVVGTGTGLTQDEASIRNTNALRVTRQGAVLIKESGDISMGEFTSGEQP